MSSERAKSFVTEYVSQRLCAPHSFLVESVNKKKNEEKKKQQSDSTTIQALAVCERQLALWIFFVEKGKKRRRRWEIDRVVARSSHSSPLNIIVAASRRLCMCAGRGRRGRVCFGKPSLGGCRDENPELLRLWRIEFSRCKWNLRRNTIHDGTTGTRWLGSIWI